MRAQSLVTLEQASCTLHCQAQSLALSVSLRRRAGIHVIQQSVQSGCSHTKRHESLKSRGEQARVLSLSGSFDADASGADSQTPTGSCEETPRPPVWALIWYRLLALAAIIAAGLKRWLGGLTTPKAASVAEARQEAQKRVQGQDKLGAASKHGKEYKMALARTRQAVSIQKALQYQRLANPARAKVELQRALSENAVCRAPLLAARYSKEQMQGLYKLYLETTELPPNYAHLLQLQDMLDLDKSDAEKLESDIMDNAAAFSI